MQAADRGIRWVVGASTREVGCRSQASWADARGKRWFVGASSRKGKPNGEYAAYYTGHHAGEDSTAASSRATAVTATITDVTTAKNTNASAIDATNASCATAAATNTKVDVVVLTFYEEISRPGSACFDEAPIVDESIPERRRKSWLGDRKQDLGRGLAT